jgi:hypothetical protein
MRHPKCLGYIIYTLDGNEYGCDYNTTINCDECKYANNGIGKDPAADCNQNV